MYSSVQSHLRSSSWSGHSNEQKPGPVTGSACNIRLWVYKVSQSKRQLTNYCALVALRSIVADVITTENTKICERKQKTAAILMYQEMVASVAIS